MAGTGPTWTFDYSTAWQTKVTGPNSATTTYSFDRLGRVTKVVDAAGNPAQASYTATSFVASRTDALAAVGEFDYDPKDNLTVATSPTGATDEWAYADTAHPYSPSSHTSSAGNATDYTYDGPGNLNESTNALAATASLTHNPDGTVATATAPGGGVTTYAYNAARELITITPPAGGSLGPQSFTYDGVGRMKTATSGAGMTTTYTYDVLDRPTGETHSDATPALVAVYDAGGRLTSRSDGSGTTTYAYDALSRLTQKTPPGGGALNYTYDAVGNLVTATDAGGTTTYRYNKLNLVDQITEPGGRTDVFAYDANHRRTDTWGATNAGVAYDASGNNVVPSTGFAVHARA
ncbi:MAG: RHS repeat-associated core domain-containing protein, partial [Actinobacteria bacterium]|nr:RHS repeat-associated core domain-containing protein [Actinomycetota bacterium]